MGSAWFITIRGRVTAAAGAMNGAITIVMTTTATTTEISLAAR
jgi:hypothetical protein